MRLPQGQPPASPVRNASGGRAAAPLSGTIRAARPGLAAGGEDAAGCLDRPRDFTRAKLPHRVPVVLTQAEVASVLGSMTGVPAWMASLLYGAGLRLLECARMRVKDATSSGSRSWCATEALTQ